MARNRETFTSAFSVFAVLQEDFDLHLLVNLSGPEFLVKPNGFYCCIYI